MSENKRTSGKHEEKTWKLDEEITFERETARVEHKIRSGFDKQGNPIMIKVNSPPTEKRPNN